MSKRLCRKCDAVIPSRTKIDGKIKLLTNRKFCLSCSPWGLHNTSKNDPEERGKQSKPYAEWSDKWKKSLIASNVRRTKERKQKLVELSGGKCSECGYSKCMKALCFHHKNPEDKCFPLSGSVFAQKSWKDILIEHAKCIMLCCNCHIELHDEQDNKVKNG